MGGRRVSDIMQGVEFDRKRKVANNTIEYWIGKEKRIRLHNTDIVIIRENGDMVLNTNGWRTVTTKDRMNMYIPGRGIRQDKGIWYIDGKVYADGMTITKDGKLLGVGPDARELYETQKQIKKYVAGFMAALVKREIPQPSNGDCWYCLMKVSEGKDKGKSLGDATRNNSHIVSHMEEGYYVPSLLMNAIDAFPVCQFARGCVGYWLKYHDDNPGEWLIGIGVRDVKRALTRYMKRQMGIAS